MALPNFFRDIPLSCWAVMSMLISQFSLRDFASGVDVLQAALSLYNRRFDRLKDEKTGKNILDGCMNELKPIPFMTITKI